MNSIDIDFLTAFFAAIIFMVIGAVWYSKALFGTIWINKQKLPSKPENAWRAYLCMFVIAYLTSIGLAIVLGFFGATSTTDGIYIGLGVAIFFIATSQASSIFWTKKPWIIYLIDVGYWVVSLAVMGGIIAA